MQSWSPASEIEKPPPRRDRALKSAYRLMEVRTASATVVGYNTELVHALDEAIVLLAEVAGGTARALFAEKVR